MTGLLLVLVARWLNGCCWPSSLWLLLVLILDGRSLRSIEGSLSRMYHMHIGLYRLLWLLLLLLALLLPLLLLLLLLLFEESFLFWRSKEHILVKGLILFDLFLFSCCQSESISEIMIQGLMSQEHINELFLTTLIGKCLFTHLGDDLEQALFVSFKLYKRRDDLALKLTIIFHHFTFDLFLERLCLIFA